MTTEEFRQRVEEAASYQPALFRETAIAHYVQNGWCGNQHVAKCVALVAELAKLNRTPDRSAQTETKFIPLSPVVRLAEEQLLETISESVRQIRVAIFGTSHARFTPERYREAIEWLEELENKTRKRVTPEERERISVLRKEIRTRMAELARIRGAEESGFHCEPRQVRYAHPDFTYNTRVLRAHPGSPLFPLVKGVSQIAATTGYRESALVAYVLCDIPPIFPRLLLGHVEETGLELPDGTRLRRETATITLQDFSVSAQEIQRTVQQIRREYGESSENAALRIILQRLGGVPYKPPLSFWREVARKWIAAELETRGADPGEVDIDKTARALSKRFRRSLTMDQQRALRQQPPTRRRSD